MPKVPLPSIGLQTGASTPYAAPSVPGAMQDVAGRQISQLGQGMTEFGSGVAQAARVLQDQADDAMVTEGFTKWADTVSQIMSGPDGLLRKEGKAATGYHRAKALGEIEKSWREIERSMQNDVQRGMFREAVNKHMIGVKERAYGHEAEQLRVYNVGQADAMRTQSARTAIEAFLNRSLTPEAKMEAAAAELLALGGDKSGGQGPEPPTLRGKTYEQAKAEADDFTRQKNTAIGQANRIADLKGWAPDDPRREELVRDTTTMIHAGIVENLITTGRTKQAKDHIAGLSSKDVHIDALTKMKEVVRRATVNDNGAMLASETVARIDKMMMPRIAKEKNIAVRRDEVFGGDAYRMGVNEIDKQFETGKIDADERRVALAELEATHNRRRQMWADKTREVTDRAERVLGADSQLRVDSPDFPPDLLFDLRKYGGLDAARRFEGGRPRVTRDADYAEVWKVVDSGELRGMSTSDLYNRFYSKLSPEHWNELQQFHAGANKPKSSTGRSVFADTARMNLTAYDAGIIKSPAGPKGDDEERRHARFLIEVDKRLAQEPDGPVSNERLQEIADEVAAQPRVSVDVSGNDPDNVWLWELPAMMTEEQRERGIAPGTRSQAYVRVWDDDEVYLLSQGRLTATKLGGFFKGRKLNTDDTLKLHYLARKIPPSDVDEVLTMATDNARKVAKEHGVSTERVVVSPDDVKASWDKLRADRLREQWENRPEWQKKGYTSELRYKAGQRYPR